MICDAHSCATMSTRAWRRGNTEILLVHVSGLTGVRYIVAVHAMIFVLVVEKTSNAFILGIQSCLWGTVCPSQAGGFTNGTPVVFDKSVLYSIRLVAHPKSLVMKTAIPITPHIGLLLDCPNSALAVGSWGHGYDTWDIRAQIQIWLDLGMILMSKQ